MAINNPELVKKICKMFPEKIAVGVDAKNGFLAAEGWTKTSKVKVKEIVKIYEDAGVCALIFTDIEKDGVLEGVNIDDLCKILNSTSTPSSLGVSFTLCCTNCNWLLSMISSISVSNTNLTLPTKRIE